MTPTPDERDKPVPDIVGPATFVAGLWYYLAPPALIVVVLLLALFYWANDEGPQRDPAEPAVGTSGELTPGGRDPEGRPRDTQDEIESRDDPSR